MHGKPIELSLLHKQWWTLRDARLKNNKCLRTDFTAIYQGGGWDGGGGETICGNSARKTSAKKTIRILQSLISELHIKTLLDIPCGDFNWMQYVNIPDVTYIGADIIPDLIARNNEFYRGANISFCLLDIRSDCLPRSDLLLARDIFNHLCYDEIFASLSNIKLSGCRWFLAPTRLDACNVELDSSGFRPLNLLAPPISLPIPDACFREGINPDSTRFLCLWDISQLVFYYDRFEY